VQRIRIIDEAPKTKKPTQTRPPAGPQSILTNMQNQAAKPRQKKANDTGCQTDIGMN